MKYPDALIKLQNINFKDENINIEEIHELQDQLREEIKERISELTIFPKEVQA